MTGQNTGSKVSPEQPTKKCKNISNQKIAALQNKSGGYFQDGQHKKEMAEERTLKRTLLRM